MNDCEHDNGIDSVSWNIAEDSHIERLDAESAHYSVSPVRFTYVYRIPLLKVSKIGQLLRLSMQSPSARL